MGSNFFILGRGSKNILGSIFLFFEGVQIKIGVQFYLFWGATKNWGSNLFYFCGPKKLGVQLIGGPNKCGPIFSFWVQKNGVQLFYFLGGGGIKKIGSNFRGGPFYLFLWSKKLGVQ